MMNLTSEDRRPIPIRVDYILTVRKSGADDTLVRVAFGQDGMALYQVNESLEWIQQLFPESAGGAAPGAVQEGHHWASVRDRMIELADEVAALIGLEDGL